jgi:hypothetical protein
LAALGAVLGSYARSNWRGRFVSGKRLGAPSGASRSDSIEELEAMPNCCDAKLLQGLVRQARKNRLVYFVLAERRLIPFEAQAPQPTPISMMGVLIPHSRAMIG